MARVFPFNRPPDLDQARRTLLNVRQEYQQSLERYLKQLRRHKPDVKALRRSAEGLRKLTHDMTAARDQYIEAVQLETPHDQNEIQAQAQPSFLQVPQLPQASTKPPDTFAQVLLRSHQFDTMIKNTPPPKFPEVMSDVKSSMVKKTSIDGDAAQMFETFKSEEEALAQKISDLEAELKEKREQKSKEEENVEGERHHQQSEKARMQQLLEAIPNGVDIDWRVSGMRLQEAHAVRKTLDQLEATLHERERLIPQLQQHIELLERNKQTKQEQLELMKQDHSAKLKQWTIDIANSFR